MPKKDMKKALGASLRAEERAVKSRFEKAETALAQKKTNEPEEPRKNGADKVIRDSFTIPAVEYEVISHIKRRCMKVGIGVNKSEVLRAGLTILKAMTDRELARAFETLTRVKTGRPPVKK
jgi:hypothetical protein